MAYTDPKSGGYSDGEPLPAAHLNAFRDAHDSALYGDTQLDAGAYLCLSQKAFSATSGPIQPTESIVRLTGAITATVTVELPVSAGTPAGAVMFITTNGSGSGAGVYDVVSGSGGSTVFQLDATDSGGGVAYYDGAEWRPAAFGGGAVTSASNW